MSSKSTSRQNLSELAKLIRYYIIKTAATAGSGHPTSSLSAVELMTTLFFGGFFRTDLDNPKNPNNDRLIFSKGHASPLFYSLYKVAGKTSEEEILTYRDFDSRLEGHPSMRFEYTEAPTGSLGQGLGIGVGMALNAKLDKLDYKTYVLLGDSEVAEGSVWEAANLASHYKLDNLVAILDVNRLGQTGETMFGHDLDSYESKFKAFGWRTMKIDGHNFEEITKAYTDLSKNYQPTAIIAKTFKGKGVSFAQNKENWHGKAFTGEYEKQALADLGKVNLELTGEVAKPEFKESNNLAQEQKTKSIGINLNLNPEQKIATREVYGKFLEKIGEINDKVVVLDAETSNSTYAEGFKKYGERFVESFIAEQNMVSMALGLAQRGKIPMISTFAAFFTRAFDQIRMSQYANTNIKFIGSHCGVSIGEDGFSQMALEDLAMFRSVSGMTVLYPGDGISCGKLLGKAVENYGNFYLRMTRAKTPIIYKDSEEFEIGGSKTLFLNEKDRVTILAAGITLHEAFVAVKELKLEGIDCRLIDLYSIKPLDEKTLIKANQETRAVIVVEDHYSEGGIYEAVCASQKITKPIYSLAVNKRPRSGMPAELLSYEEIDTKAIISKVKEVIKKS